jgi:hypothetical protein
MWFPMIVAWPTPVRRRVCFALHTAGFAYLVGSHSFYYSRITSIKSSLFCMTTVSARLTNLTVPLPESIDCSCNVSRRILASPSLWLQKHTDLCVHDFAHSADFWHKPMLANGTCAWNWRLCGINPAINQHKVRIPSSAQIRRAIFLSLYLSFYFTSDGTWLPDLFPLVSIIHDVKNYNLFNSCFY